MMNTVILLKKYCMQSKAEKSELNPH